MKVTLAQQGGLAAGIRRVPMVVDSASLAAPVVAELTRLVTAARGNPATRETSPGKARDAIRYTITIEEGERPTVLSQSDTDMSQDFAALLGWLQQNSK